MPTQVYFFTSIGCSLIMWSAIARTIWPQLRARSTVAALRPLLTLHGFRFIGLSFLVPGVVSPALPLTFARDAAYGDFLAAVLAMAALLLLPGRAGMVTAWVFNAWGSLDLLNAFYQAAHSGMMPGQLGATYYLPAFVVPLLLVTHVMIFRILLNSGREIALNSVADRRQSTVDSRVSC